MSETKLRLYKREGSDRYYVDFRYEHPLSGERDRFRKASPYTSKRKARRWGRKRLQERTDRNWWREKEERQAKENVPTVAQFREKFLETRRNRIADSTYESYKYRLEWIEEVLAQVQLHQIDATHFDDLMAAMVDEGRSNKTVRNTFSVLRKMLKEAQKRDYVDELPDVEWPKTSDPEWHWLREDEAAELVEATKEYDGYVPLHEMVCTALWTGLRLGELLALKWTRVDLENHQIHVQLAYTHGQQKSPKGDANRTVPIPDSLVEVLRDHKRNREENGPKSEWVFCDPEGEILNKQKVRDPLTAAYDRTSIPDEKGKGWHILRHSYASHLASRGVPLHIIQEVLGHQTIEVTERYSHLLPGTEEAVIPHIEGFAEAT